MRLESAHMDKKLLLIRHLYGEADEESKLNQLLEEPDLKEEYQALSEAKFWLDHTKREKPAPDALQNVLAMAANPGNLDAHEVPGTASPETALPDHKVAAPDQKATEPEKPRTDRPPVARQRFKRRIFGLSAFTMAVVITTLIGYQWFAPGNSVVAPAFDNQVSAEAEVNSELKSTAEAVAAGAARLDDSDNSADLLEAEAQPSLQMARSAPSASALADAAVDSTLPDWDRVDEIIRYKQRIEMLLEQNQDLAWDETAVPLEALQPDRLSSPQLQQARSRSGNN